MQVNTANLVPEGNSPIRQKIEKSEDKKPTEKISEAKTGEKAAQEENLQKIQAVFAENHMSLKYSRDEKTQALVVEMVNNKTGEAVLQIPSEVSLKLAALFVKMQGQFVNEKK